MEKQKAAFEESNQDSPSAMRLYRSYKTHHGQEQCHLSWHWHDTLELYYMVSGTGYLCVDSERYLLKKGQAAIIHMGQAHAGYFYDSGDLVVDAVHLNPSALSFRMDDSCQQKLIGPFQRGELRLPCAILGECAWERQTLSHIQRMIQLLYDRRPGYELAVKAAFYGMFAELLQAGVLRQEPLAQQGQSVRMGKLKQVLTYLGEHYAEPVSVAQLAALADLSSDHFYKFFKGFVHMSPMDYLNYLRVQKSLLLLLSEQPGSVTDIALQVGFYDGSHYAKLFRKFMGMSPTQYKSKAIAENGQAIGVAFSWDQQNGVLRYPAPDSERGNEKEPFPAFRQKKEKSALSCNSDGDKI